MKHVVMTEDEFRRLQAALLSMSMDAAQNWGMGGAPQCKHGNIWEDCTEQCECGHECRDHVDVGADETEDPEDVALRSIGGHEPRHLICAAHGCTCGLHSVEEQEPCRVGGNFPYFIEYRAHGRFQARLGRELSDGRTVWLSNSTFDGNVTSESYARGMLTLRKLLYAVRAAKEWKRKAQHRSYPWILGGIGAMAAMWLGKGVLGGKS
jgi:hypothetical protein